MLVNSEISFSESDDSCRLNSAKAGTLTARFLSTRANGNLHCGAQARGLPHPRASPSILQTLIHSPIWVHLRKHIVLPQVFFHTGVRRIGFDARASCGKAALGFTVSDSGCLHTFFRRTHSSEECKRQRRSPSSRLTHHRHSTWSQPGNLNSTRSRCV